MGSLYLAVQGLGALVWWLVLALEPRAWDAFLPPGLAPAVLLGLLPGDLLLFAGGSLAAAWGLARRRAWAHPVLCVHAGAAGYAALYALGLWACTGRAAAGALLMLPALVVPGWLAWRLRP